MHPSRQTVLMAQARQAATFDSMLLTHIIYDGEENVSSRRAALARVESTLGITDNMKLPHLHTGLDRREQYLEGLRRGRAIVTDMLQHDHTHFVNLTERSQLANATPFGLNFLMFRRTINLQGTAEQKRYWLPLIDRMEINGCYAQTELGHGSHVRGMETTATFDSATGEFILNSPTVTATKFWPGGLGISCSHAVVAARLETRGVDHGVHWFVVQIRNLSDFTPLKGVTLGDVGQKMAYNGTCNGYAHFNDLRVPRSSLLAAHARVLPDGAYVRNEAGSQETFAKQSYATMLEVRRVVIHWAAFGLAQPLTVATRYAVVREQGAPTFSSSTCPEVSILAYKSQHQRLLSLISQAYAILFASKEFDDRFEEYQQEKREGKLGRLSFIHAVSAGLKAWATQAVAAGAEEARKMCGGHGYLVISGLPDMVATACAAATFEGENYVMWQQTLRYMFKQVGAIQAGRTVDSDMIESLSGYQQWLQVEREKFPPSYLLLDSNHISEPASLLKIFQHHFHRLLSTAHSFYTQQARTSSPAEAWNTSLTRLLPAAHAYIEYLVLESMQRRVAAIGRTQPSLFPVLSRLTELFALTTITNPGPSFTSIPFAEDRLLTTDHFLQMRARIDELLGALLPDNTALTDAWDFTDASLCSALGCRDGNVYERLMSWTKQLPVNQQDLARQAWTIDGGIGEFLRGDMKPAAKARL
ncbi:acyl-CoA oxidase [Aspergillus aculeatinus CBS 121060]|uniref:Acyl-CoA oxidase n=1 Tax=Aspergillus aculeatinus CBS 121060 TaxID=1448322 RepID=A0ACD1HFT3_9EURO|nr:acyl-CoA oxidase [Aspergillus aculeatinus CBS 121060]RAH72516.1 acyl-CoA oxidase [Aspergillus aculeatinus CBS 121060]